MTGNTSTQLMGRLRQALSLAVSVGVVVMAAVVDTGGVVVRSTVTFWLLQLALLQHSLLQSNEVQLVNDLKRLAKSIHAAVLSARISSNED